MRDKQNMMMDGHHAYAYVDMSIYQYSRYINQIIYRRKKKSDLEY